MLSLAEAYRRITDEERERSCLVTDPRRSDNPIVFANDAFVRLTGYDRDEVLGRNCRFLQGKDSDPRAARALREAIEREEAITVDILNYKKDGTSFWNRLRIRPVCAESGEIESFVGILNAIDPGDVRSEPQGEIRD